MRAWVQDDMVEMPANFLVDSVRSKGDLTIFTLLPLSHSIQRLLPCDPAVPLCAAVDDGNDYSDNDDDDSDGDEY